MTTVQHLWENSKSASTKRGTIPEGNTDINKIGLLSFDKCKFTKPFKWRNVELVKQHTGHIFIGYKKSKIVFLAISA